MSMKSKVKWLAIGGLVLSSVSLMVHLFLAKSSTAGFVAFTDDLTYLSIKGSGYTRLWGLVKSLDSIYPYSTPRITYPGILVILQNVSFYCE